MRVRAWMRPGAISCSQAATYQALAIHMRSSRTGFCRKNTAASGRRHIGLVPALVGIERGDRAGARRRLRAEVLLVDNAAIADDEGHDAGLAVDQRRGDGREAADQPSAHEIVVGAALVRR